MSLRAFVTGVTGFVSSHLARELHRQGWEVHAIERSRMMVMVQRGHLSRASPGWQLKATARARTLIAGLTGKEPDITPESAVMIIHHLHCDSTRAQRQLDYRVTPLRPLVQDTIDWLWKAGLMA